MLRTVAQVVPAVRTLEGGGFPVRRPFPTSRLDHVDPFLLLDEMGPVDWAPGQAVGAPEHPHRGFETVTYMLAGEFEHADSAGNRGRLQPGDVQWMTAGAGVVHSEMPSARVRREGGSTHGVQLWVNLPASAKMIRPRYQEVPAPRIPIGASPSGDVAATVIAGEAFGVRAAIDTHIPIHYLHYRLQPGARVEHAADASLNAMIYVMEGRGAAGPDGRPVASGDLAIFRRDGGIVRFQAGDVAMSLLLLAGRPIGEPVARYGPFVMNTREELVRAVEDYRAGRLGSISP